MAPRQPAIEPNKDRSMDDTVSTIVSLAKKCRHWDDVSDKATHEKVKSAEALIRSGSGC